MNIDLQARHIQPLRPTFSRVLPYLKNNRPASRYQEATLGIQPTHNFHYRPSWEPQYELFDKQRSAIQMQDWDSLQDPRQYYYATWTIARARQQETMDSNNQFIESHNLIDRIPDQLREKACQALTPLRHVAWAANMNNCQICATGYGAALTSPAMMHAMDHLGIAQYLTRISLALGDTEGLDAGKQAWLHEPQWQPLRKLVEDMLVIQDPMELFVAQNFVLDGLLYPFVYTHYIDDYLAINGGTALGMLSVFMSEWYTESSPWVNAVLKTCAAESEANKAQLNAWYMTYTEKVKQSLEPVADFILGEIGQSLLNMLKDQLDTRAHSLGICQ